MQATSRYPRPLGKQSLGRNLGYFLTPILIALAVASMLLATALALYENRHRERVFTGVSVMGVDLSGMTPDEATAALAGALSYSNEAKLTLIDPASDRYWRYTPAQLGIRLDADETVAAAYAVGRQGGPLSRLQDLFQTWYYGRDISPVIVFDESRLQEAVAEVAAEIEQEPINASWQTDGATPTYQAGAVGRRLDRSDLQQRLLGPVQNLQAAEIQLLIHDVYPPTYDAPATAARLESLLAEPFRFYFPEPLADLDLNGVTLTAEELAPWVRVELATRADGGQEHRLFVDENAARNWLEQFGSQIRRAPVNARYYFNDDTRELVLVAPHVNGRELDVDATLQAFLDSINNGGHATPLIVKEIVPAAHSGATAAELGITELITETTTWFYGSSDARKHNIARAAANFFGVVIEPGEEFSFNRYLGTVSEAEGFEEGLIIVGGRTIKGIGGGVCQVSTTLYQTAFWAGFPIVERWEHGYMVGYYNDGEGPGMDATVFSPVVDFRFINNTPHHLLIENYYNEEFESLTFKFYSTSMGRRVEKTEPVFSNVVEPPTEDVWEFDPDLPEGTVRQIDWATEGADVSVQRTVYNADGQVIEQRVFESNYIPWPNVYHYGPGVEPGDYSLVPDDN